MTDDDKRRIERINEISKLGRSSWIGLLAYLAFIFVTLLAVEDADFFVPSRQTQLPLVNVSIPTSSFFIFAPILATALYVYLHLFLIKLWDAIAEAPERISTHPKRQEWIPLEEAIHPWLANDLACAARGKDAHTSRPLRRLGGFTTMCLVWFAGPAVIYAFWLVSTGAHDEWLTLGIGACLWIALFTMASSMLHSAVRLKKKPFKLWHRVCLVLSMVWITWTIVSLSWRYTESGFEHYAKSVLPLWYGEEEYDLRFRHCGPGIHNDCLRDNGEPLDPDTIEDLRIAALPWMIETNLDDLMPTNLFEAELVPLPGDWRDREVARMAFRETWCRRESLPMAVCDHRPSADRTPPPHVEPARKAYCETNGIDGSAACNALFVELNRSFDADWLSERASLRKALPALKLQDKDLRGAFAARTSLVNADLSYARLDGAIFWETRMEGANLFSARIEGADFSNARMERVNFGMARMRDAQLIGANMDGAAFWETRMEGANLGFSRMEGAMFQGAFMDGAILNRTRMSGAQFQNAHMRGTVLLGGDMRSANFADADLAAAAHGADFRGAIGLEQAQLDRMIGDRWTLLPDGDAPDTGEPYSIPSCWPDSPDFFEEMVGAMTRFWAGTRTPDQLREEYLCGDRDPVRWSTRLPVDAPYPEGHPLVELD